MTLALLLAVSVGTFAVPAKVVYTDGPATVRLSSGKTEAVKTGRSYDTGDSIRTGKAGEVELSQEGLAIRVGPSTVFTLMEKDVGGKPKGVLAVTLGAVRIKYERLTGSEPMIQSVGCIAGVRGTELTVWAGADGASQIIVTEGLVNVEAYGREVQLGPDDAVEVINGKPPGDKFTVQRDELDRGTWDAERVAAILADPLAALSGMRDRLAYYTANVSDSYAWFLDAKSRLQAAREAMAEVGRKEGKDAAEAYEKQFVAPLVSENKSAVLEYRYYALAALEMRRFVGSRMYLLLKVAYAATPDDPTWKSFLGQYAAFVADFESGIVPVLVDADF